MAGEGLDEDIKEIFPFFVSDSNDSSNYGRMFNGDHRVNKGSPGN